MKPDTARPSAKVLPQTPALLTFLQDAKRAGIIAMDKRGRKRPDDNGTTLDRHAWRTSYLSWLAAAGVATLTLKQLTRHGSLNTTTKHCIAPAPLPTAAVQEPPSLNPQTDEPKALPRRKAVGLEGVGEEDAAVEVVLNSRQRPRAGLKVNSDVRDANKGESPVTPEPNCVKMQSDTDMALGVTEREHPTKSPVNQPVSREGDAFSDASDAPKPQPAPTLPADLAELVYAWPTLAPAIRAGILAMIQAAKGGAR